MLLYATMVSNMASKNWHPNFIKYTEFIAAHPNYKGLPIERGLDGSLNWVVANKTSTIRQGRIKWCENKARELGFKIEPGVYAKVMRKIHPTGEKVCQVCGKKMSIFYHYPTVHLINKLEKKFGIRFPNTTHISEIWDELLDSGNKESDLTEFFLGCAGVDKTLSGETDRKSVIETLEDISRNSGKAILSPGAMSNFPDRFDGFHTYNLCCRSTQDTGRHADNMKSYTRDRRAYEYWSDGNIHAANMFMGSQFFKGTSADHIGPISLGFVHDPRYLQPMDKSDNSTKRDRLTFSDIEKILEVESRTKIYPISWYSAIVWEYVKQNYKLHPEKIPSTYRDMLKQSMVNFMYILSQIIHQTQNGNKYLIDCFLKNNVKYFNYSYEFNARGDIVKQSPRHFTDRSNNEMERYFRIALNSVDDYNAKENRNMSNSLNSAEKALLNDICKSINAGESKDTVERKIRKLVSEEQNSIIESYS